MNTVELNSVLSTFPQPYFTGVFAANRLPIHVTPPACIIVNTDSDKKPGTHWVSIFIDKHYNGKFFDSYGLPPLVKDHLTFIRRNTKKWSYSTKRYQATFSNVCGLYALVTLYCEINKIPMCSLFTSDYDFNDKKVHKLFKYMFKRHYLKMKNNCSFSCGYIQNCSKYKNILNIK